MMILLLVLFIIIYILINNYENFNDLDESQFIDYHVIHMKNIQKQENINDQMIKLGKKINIFDAVIGKNVKQLNKYDENLKLNYEFKSPAELGCYLSHFMIIKKAITSNKKYTVIFEDDFKIVTKDLNTEILNITKKLNDNFDIIYLGNLYESKSEKIVDNIYKKNDIIQLLGCHAYLINNKNAQQIYNKLLNINNPIDNLFENLINQNKLNYYVIYPSLVIQDNSFESELRPSYQIVKRNVIQTTIEFFNYFI